MTRNLSRRTSLGIGLLLLVASLGLISAGAVAAWARSGSAYVGLGAHGTYRTDRYALATDSTDWRTTFLGWAGSVQLKVSSGSKPVFVGVAPPRTVNRYLRDVSYTTISADAGHDSSRREHDGAAPAVAATDLTAWTAHAQGTGVHTLRWSATDGPQVVVAMNADRSRLVKVQVVSAAITLERMPGWVPLGLVVLGIVTLPLSAVVLSRRAREGASGSIVANRPR